MKDKEFSKRIYESIVVENMEIYKDLFQKTKIDSSRNTYWLNAVKLFNELSEDNKLTFFRILEQVQVDTISSFLGIIDGVVTFSDKHLDVDFKINDKKINGDLQDYFLEYIEDKNH